MLKVGAETKFSVRGVPRPENFVRDANWTCLLKFGRANFQNTSGGVVESITPEFAPLTKFSGRGIPRTENFVSALPLAQHSDGIRQV